MLKRIDVKTLVLSAQSDQEIDAIYAEAKKIHTRCFIWFNLCMIVLLGLCWTHAVYDLENFSYLLITLAAATLCSLAFVPSLYYATAMHNQPNLCKNALDLVNKSDSVRAYRDSLLENGRQLYLAHYFEMQKIYEDDIKTLDCRKLHSLS